jgi:Fibronectin type III domain
MKNIKIILGILLVAFFSFSCENEALDPKLLDQIEITDDSCGIPTNLQTTATNNGTTINLSWTPSVGVTSWEIEYGLTQSYVLGAGTKLNSTVPTININNLFATNNYTFSVRSVCGTGFGEWSEPKNTLGVNLNCANPSALTVVRSSIDQATATINWTAPATQNSWEISYGTVGFNPTQGTIIASNTKPKAISGLATISYDFYVRAKCSPTENSNWVGPINLAALTITNPSTDDYWPFALNNKWAFKKNGSLQPAMKIISLDPIAGNNYFTFENFFANPNIGAGVVATVRGRKVGNDYFYRYQTSGSIVIDPLEIIILKSALSVNETWTQNLTQVATIPQLPNAIVTQVTFTGKILEKGISITVNGINYTNVIKSELIQNSGGILNTNTYWFAKGIGPIKIINVTSGETITQELDSYMLN